MSTSALSILDDLKAQNPEILKTLIISATFDRL